VRAQRGGHGGVLFFLVKMMFSVWTPPIFVRQAMAVVDMALSYEIPRWCKAIYVKARFPHYEATDEPSLNCVASNLKKPFWKWATIGDFTQTSTTLLGVLTIGLVLIPMF
jgi:hypothetical protein